MNSELITPEFLKSLRSLAIKRSRFTSNSDEYFSVAETAVARRLSSYDPAKNVNFAAWGYSVAKFAILDFQREQDLLTRQERAKVKQGRVIERYQVSDSVLTFVAVEQPQLPDGPSLVGCLMQLEPVQALILYQMYFLDTPGKCLADFLEVTESRISQCRQEALVSLRRIYLRSL